MKKFFVIFILMAFLSIPSFGDYIALKTGKVIVTDGKIRVEGENVFFKTKGSDLEVTIPLSKVNIEKTQYMNTHQEKKEEKKKPVKTFTNKDLGKGSDNLSIVYTPGSSENNDGEEGEQESLDELFNVPSYPQEDIIGKEPDWWNTEVQRLHDMLIKSVEYNRRVIQEYNELVMRSNAAKTPDEQNQIRSLMGPKMEIVNDSKELIKLWLNAMKELSDNAREQEIDTRYYSRLEQTYEKYKDLLK